MIKKMVWAIPTAIGGVAIAATAIGLGYTGSQAANPYADFFRRPAQPGDSALVNAYTSAVTNGAKVVVGAGFTHTNPITSAVSQEFFQKNQTGFVLLDDPFNPENPNGYQVASITFRISEAAFLTGIALGEYLNYYQDIFAPNPEDRLTYAAWGGLPFGTILCFMSGFQQGVNFFNNKIAPKVTGYKKIHQITSANSFAGGFAPQDGKTPAEQLMTGNGTKTWDVYEQGDVTSGANAPVWTNQETFKKIAEKESPDAVLVVAGPQVSVAIDEINKNNDRTKTVVIGVDVAQEKDLSLNRDYVKPLKNADGSKIIEKPICFSIMKDLANTTNRVLQNISEGKVTPDESGNGYGGLGWNSKGDLTNGGVSISDAGKPFLYNALVAGGLISGAKITDPTKTLTEDEYKDYYQKSMDAVKSTHDYLYNQGVLDEKNPSNPNNSYVATSNISDSNKKPGYQIRNQYVAPYSTDNSGKPNNLGEESLFFDDNIVNKSLVKPEDKAKHEALVKFKKEQLQNDIANANNDIDVNTLKNDLKIVLSESTSVLLDNSFSQSGFEGILRFLYHVDKKNLGYLYQDFRQNILHLPPLAEGATAYTKDNKTK